jgi:hypothetical protein
MSRDPLDRYYTDDRLAAACMAFLRSRFSRPSVVLEPCAGGGAFGRAAPGEFPGVTVRGCDIDPDAAPGYPCDRVPAADWRPDIAGAGGPVWIVTNPHYQGVYDTVRGMRALQRRLGAQVLALLLRETTIGHLIAGDYPPHFLAVSPIRPRWGGPGGAALTSGDTCGSVLCIWHADAEVMRGPTTIEALPTWRAKGSR